MTISREEFEAGYIDIALPILEILESRPDLAFSSEFVRQLLAQMHMRIAPYEEVFMALERLVEEGQVQAREINDSRWYTIPAQEPRSLGFRQEGRDDASD